jgi:ABC-type multidrug transport system ATPase subunit
MGHRQVLDGIDLDCAPSEVVIIFGENGAGKSTLLRVVGGILEADSGEIGIGGRSMRTDGVEVRRHLGYVPDASDALPDLLVSEFASLVCALKGVAPRRGSRRAPPDELVDRLGVRAFIGQRMSTLSFGQRKRVYLLAALIGEPWLLVLDEPTNGLDPEGVDLLCELIRTRRMEGRGTLLSTNDHGFAQSLGGTTYRLEQGRLGRVSAGSSA